MHTNLIKRIFKENPKRFGVSIRISELENIFKYIIKKDTGVDIGERLSLDYDNISFSIVTILKEEDFSEKELEDLGHYDFREWYNTTNYILASLFGESYDKISVFTSEEEIYKYDDDYTVFIDMPLNVYEKLKEMIQCQQ